MLLTWLVGIHGMTTGCATVGYLRDGHLPDIQALETTLGESRDPLQSLVLVGEMARLRASADAHAVTFPLGAAKLVLGGFLLVASGHALTGRKGARGLALQALVANAGFAAVEYVLMRGVRAVWIEDVVRAAAALPSLDPDQGFLLYRAFWWWIERVRFAVFDVGLFVVAAFALTRRRTKLFFEAAEAAAADSADEP